MLRYSISYVDYNGNPHVDDLWFHVSRSSVLRAEDAVYNSIVTLGKDLQQKANFIAEIQQLKKEENEDENPFSERNSLTADAVRSVAKLLDKLVDFSYGTRPEDGLRFMQSPEILEKFKQSCAYEAFVDKMVTNPNEMIGFIENLMKM